MTDTDDQTALKKTRKPWDSVPNPVNF